MQNYCCTSYAHGHLTSSNTICSPMMCIWITESNLFNINYTFGNTPFVISLNSFLETTLPIFITCLEIHVLAKSRNSLITFHSAVDLLIFTTCLLFKLSITWSDAVNVVTTRRVPKIINPSSNPQTNDFGYDCQKKKNNFVIFIFLL